MWLRKPGERRSFGPAGASFASAMPQPTDGLVDLPRSRLRISLSPFQERAKQCLAARRIRSTLHPAINHELLEFGPIGFD
jgi:hypothetical protein